MRRRKIRPIVRKPKASFAERLEARARKLVRHTRPVGKPGEFDIAAGIEREIALTLDHIDDLRRVHQQLRRSLLRQECYLQTEIRQREPLPHQYDDRHLRDRDRLRDRLRAVEKERRERTSKVEEQLQGLHFRLLGLTEQRRHLSMDIRS